MEKLFCFIALLPFALFADNEAEFQQRADFIIDVIYDYGWVEADNEYRPSGFGGCFGSGSLSDYGKYVYPWMMAHYEKDGAIALEGAETQKVKNTFDTEMHNCPTFHFNLTGLPRLIYQYNFEPNFWRNIHGGHLQDYLHMVFSRNDSYNAFTGEGTENHLGMSRNPGYLYAQLAIDSGYTDVFPSAPAMLDQMKDWIMNTSRTLLHTGAAEWNSSTYGAYNIIGWMLLYDFAHDPEVQKAAHAVLDYYACELALHYQQGMTSGSEMRGGSSMKSLNTETDIFAWLWFGDAPKDFIKANFNPGKALQTVHAATSNYRPPAIAVQLARKELTLPAMYYNSKPGYLYDNPSLIKQSFYVSNNYSMGAAYTPFGGWGGGDWQIVSWKLVARVDANTSDDAQYASGALEWGTYRRTQLFKKPYEQFAHHKNVMVHMTKRPAHHSDIYNQVQSVFEVWRNSWSNDFYQRFPGDPHKNNPVNFQQGQAPENQTVFAVSGHGTFKTIEIENIRFVELDQVYLAIRSLHNSSPQGFNEHGAFWLTKDPAPDGNLTGILLEVGEKMDFQGFADFRNQIINNTSLIKELDNDRFVYTSLHKDVMEVQYQEAGSFSEPIYDWGYGPVEPMVIHRSPPFVQPDWPSGSGHGTRAVFAVNDTVIDLTNKWAVYSGPHFNLNNGILELNDSLGRRYTVDYSGSLPVFKQDSDDVGVSPAIFPRKESTLWIYPNPTKGIITIRTNQRNAPGMAFRVTDSTGRIVKQGKTFDNTIDLSAFKAGIYSLNIFDDHWKNQKVIIQ